MREMAFEEMFDGVYCWNTTFGYFEEEKNFAVAQRVFKALRPGGMFLLDVANRDFVVAQSPSQVWYEGEGCVCMDDMSVDFITSRLRVKRSVILDDGRTRECTYSIRLYSLHELGKLLHDVGFRVTEASGHPSMPGVFFGQSSPRIVILAQRPVSTAARPSAPPPLCSQLQPEPSARSMHSQLARAGNSEASCTQRRPERPRRNKIRSGRFPRRSENRSRLRKQFSRLAGAAELSSFSLVSSDVDADSDSSRSRRSAGACLAELSPPHAVAPNSKQTRPGQERTPLVRSASRTTTQTYTSPRPRATSAVWTLPRPSPDRVPGSRRQHQRTGPSRVRARSLAAASDRRARRKRGRNAARGDRLAHVRPSRSQQLVAFARAEGMPLVPFGAGSGVCGAVLPDARTIVVDLKRMATTRSTGSAAARRRPRRARHQPRGRARAPRLHDRPFPFEHPVLHGGRLDRRARRGSVLGALRQDRRHGRLARMRARHRRRRHASGAARRAPICVPLLIGSEGTLGRDHARQAAPASGAARPRVRRVRLPRHRRPAGTRCGSCFRAVCVRPSPGSTIRSIR